jgi:hypothetical protein
MRQLQSVID